jgi:ABC-type sugar transport system ATPase subunit
MNQSAGAPAGDVILRAENISKVYPGTTALQDVDF